MQMAFTLPERENEATGDVAGRQGESGVEGKLSLGWRDGDCEKAAVSAPG